MTTMPNDEQRETAERMPVCGSKAMRVGCGAQLHWERSDGSEWSPRREMVAIRCLDCAVVFCPQCARGHFDSSRAFGDAARDAQLRAELLAPFRELAEEWLDQGWVDHGSPVDRAAAAIERSCARELLSLLPAPAEGTKADG